LEKSSEHPLAAAILAAATERKLELQDGDQLRLHHRQGRYRYRCGRRVAVGNLDLLSDLGVAGAELEARADDLRKSGATVIFVAIDEKPSESLPYPTRSRLRQRLRSTSCAAKACASSC
jgi:Cu+-exporting ATPase